MAPENDLKDRTKRFSLNILDLVETFPRSVNAKVIEGQLVRAATSVGANYRAACRARSKAEFISKIGTVIEEADECAFWLELVIDTGLCDAERAHALWDEANEIVAIMTASRKTAEAALRRSATSPS
jgi:four helix bundle protein